MSKVNVSLGMTLNLGNFQSLRIEVGLEDEKRNNENTAETFERVYKFVEDKLAEKVEEARDTLGVK